MKFRFCMSLFLVYGVLMVCSIFAMSVFDLQWWKPIPPGDTRGMGIFVIHLLGLILGGFGLFDFLDRE